MKAGRAFLGLMLGLVFPVFGQAQATGGTSITFEAPVVQVLRGDTLELIWGGRARRLEVAEIEAPAPDAPFDAEAQRRTAELVLGERVEVRLEGRAVPGSLRGQVLLAGGGSLAHELVRAGLARWLGWCSATGDASLGRLERQARAARRGLWSRPESGAEVFPQCRERSPTSLVPPPSPPAPTSRSGQSASARNCVPRSRCCKICSKGKACGNSCISRSYTCHKGRGCACNLSEVCPG